MNVTRSFKMELPQGTDSGEYNLVLSASSEFGVASTEENVIIGLSRLTGFASLGGANTLVSIVILVIFGLIIAILLIRRYIKKKSKILKR